MQTIKLDVSDSIYDKVMLFLQSFSKKDIKLYSEKPIDTTQKTRKTNRVFS